MATTGTATGARRGELCGLRWTDLDAAEGDLDIVRTIIIVDGACVEAPTKTRQSRRIALDGVACDVLARQRRRAEKRAKEADLELGERAFVFSHDSDGQRPWRPDSISRAFRHLCHQAGFDGVRLHDLRHFAADQVAHGGHRSAHRRWSARALESLDHAQRLRVLRPRRRPARGSGDVAAARPHGPPQRARPGITA